MKSENKSELLSRALYAIKDLDSELKKKNSEEEIAIVGMSCRFPNGCNNTELFWEHIEKGQDDITDVPNDRWDSNQYYSSDMEADGKAYTQKGGFLNFPISETDAKFFNMSPREAKEVDPQQRMLLEVSWEAMENAALTDDKLNESRTGVFIGFGSVDYASLPRDRNSTGPYTATGIASNMLAGRISHTFGLQGPAICVDTACSSSLSALYLACRSLYSNECDSAVVGGVNLILNPNSYVMLCKIKALSFDGKCKTFDDDANGYVRGEGCGVVVLKRLSDAKRDNNNILAIIKGIAINHDGYTSGLTVPNGLAQEKLLRQAIRNSGLYAEDISYIETHGTGTALGDPIEVKAIRDVYGKRNKDNTLFIGAVKTNIGHLEAASGMAGLIKLVLCLQHKTIPPVVNFKKLNHRIQLDQSMVIPIKKVSWNRKGQLNAGLSSFGFSGTNVHMILSSYEQETEVVQEKQNAPYILSVAAKNPEALNEMVSAYQCAVKENGNNDLEYFCGTANMYRLKYKERAVFWGNNAEELCDRMSEWLEAVDKKENKDHTRAYIFIDGISFFNDEVEKLKKEFVLFNVTLEKLENKIKECFNIDICSQSYEKLLTFCQTVSLVELIRSFGIIIYGINGNENNKPIVEYLSGELDLLSVIRLLCCNSSISSTEKVFYDKPLKVFSVEKISADRDCVIRIGGIKQADEVVVSAKSILDDIVALVAKMYLCGAKINWSNFYYKKYIKKCVVPTYKYQKQSYWLDKVSDDIEKGYKYENPLKYSLVLSPLNYLQIEYNISDNNLSELADNQNILHIGYYLEMLDQLSGLIYDHTYYHLRNFELYQAIYFSNTVNKKIQIITEPKDELDISKFKFFSLDEGKKIWEFNAKGELIEDNEFVYSKITKAMRDEIINNAEISYKADVFDKMLYDQGFIIGDSVKWVERVWIKGNKLIAKFRDPLPNDRARQYHIKVHPGIFDACAQLFITLGKKYLGTDKMFMVKKINDFVFNNLQTSDSLWCVFEVTEGLVNNEYIEARYTIVDDEGNFVAQANEIQVKVIDSEKRESLAKAIKNEMIINAEINVELKQKLESSSYSEKQTILNDFLQDKLAELLMMPKDELALDEPLGELGMDSLVGFELKQFILKQIDVEVPMEIIIQGKPIKELSKSIIQHMSGKKSNDEEIWYQKDYSLNYNDWIVYSKIRKNPKVRIFCIPYGAAGASIYRDWNDLFSDDIEICPVQFPGKEGRIAEKLIYNIDEAVSVLKEVISPKLDVPFVIYGHSVGALIAYRLSYELEKTGHKPLALMVGAYSSPTISPNPAYSKVREVFKLLGFEDMPKLEDLYKLPEDKRNVFDDFFAHELERVNMNNEIRRAVEPVAFSEFEIVASYKYAEAESKINIPIVAFHGNEDPVVTEQEMADWRVLTNSDFELIIMEGDHFFIHRDQKQKEFIAKVNDRVIKYGIDSQI